MTGRIPTHARSLLGALLALAAGFVTPAGAAPAIALTPAFPGLEFAYPIALVQVPGEANAYYVAERAGRVLRVEAVPGQPPRAAAVLDIRAQVTTRGEGGLLGIAFHPRYPAVRQAFVSYTAPGGKLLSRIARFAVGPEGRLSGEQVLLELEQPYANHNGGWIAFGPDGLLYIGLGDGGSAGDPLDHGQNTATLLGAMLRIDVDAPPAPGKAYAIPPDNPFAEKGGRPGAGAPEIYAWGLRNPWRWSFDRKTGVLWAADVGQNAWEEVSRIEKGGNYGWRCYEGTHAYDTRGCGPAERYVPPVFEYGHDQGCSITGGYVYRGQALPALVGTYIYTDFCAGRLWGRPVDAPAGAKPVELLATRYRIASLAEDHAGELYVLHLDEPGVILKIVPAP